ncbi:MAG TPA: ester cyclase [Myxococcales bacterium]
MAQLDTSEIVRHLYQAFNDKDLDRLLGYAQPDAKVLNVPFGKTLGFRDYFSNWMTAFPDGQIEIVNLVASGDYVVAEYIGRGTNTGLMQGPDGELSPTQRPVGMRFCEIYDLRDGKVAGGRVYFDAATMMRQLEVPIAPSQRPTVVQPGFQH